jgi:2-oxoglutarate dehydrogenase E2 component (dihydrolipoamide succinyltransferase)
MDIRAPEEQTEGTRSQVLRWLKGVGESVVEHEPLIEIETDKVTVEVAAPASGVLREILKREQEEVAPGEVLGRLEIAGAGQALDVSAGAGAGAGASADGRSAPPAAREDREGDAPAAVTRASEATITRDLAPASGTSAAGASSAGGSASAVAAGAPTLDARAQARAQAVALSPAVRRLLAERGLDPASIRGTGEGGRITVDDVLAHGTASDDSPRTGSRANDDRSDDNRASSKAHAPGAASRAQSKPTPLSPAPQPSTQKAVPANAADPSLPSHSVPHSAIRKRIADHMVQSLLQTAPHVTTVFEADLTAISAHRATHRADFESRGAPLTFTAYFLAAAAAAIKEVPEANSRWTDSALEIYDVINIGVATAIEGTGLMVPVLRDVASKDLFAIAHDLNALVTAARTGKLQPADVRGGTFTISNHGVSGSLLAAPIVINQPQSAILGIGKLEKRVTVGENDEVIIRPKCYVTLTLDHRVMDGHQANRFLQVFVRTLETWPTR